MTTVVNSHQHFHYLINVSTLLSSAGYIHCANIAGFEYVLFFAPVNIMLLIKGEPIVETCVLSLFLSRRLRSLVIFKDTFEPFTNWAC